jgi:CP family cyanate transporter-like MFS transporter
LVLIAFNGRAAVGSIGPVLRDLMQALDLSVLGASLLTALPSLCFGLGAPLAPALARRLGNELGVLLALLMIAAGVGVRGLANAPSLFAGQILACFGIAVINVLLPGLVKRDFPRRIALMMGLVSMGLCAGGAAAAGSTVPLAIRFGSWAWALAIWAIPALIAAGLWAAQMPARTDIGYAPGTSWRLLRSWRAWQVTFFMGLQSALGYIVFGWLAPILGDRGMSPVDAGLVLSFSVLVQTAISPFVPVAATRGRDQRVAAALSVGVCLLGLLGCLFAPLALVWASVLVLGIGQGALFAIALTIIVLRAPSAQVVAGLSGMAQGIGYLLASAGPLVTGLLYNAFGRGAVAALCIGISAAALLFGIGAGRTGHVQAPLAGPLA